jgi:hypothetical protein
MTQDPQGPAQDSTENSSGLAVTCLCAPILGMMLFGRFAIAADLCIVVLVGFSAIGMRQRTWVREPAIARAAIASVFAFAATWGGVEWNKTRYRDLSPAEKEQWTKEYRPGEAGSPGTCSVSGFPLQLVEGTDGHSWWGERGVPVADSFPVPPHIPMARGLWALWLNFVILGLAARLVVVKLPRSMLAWTHLLGSLAAAGSLWLTRSWLIADGWT